MKKRRIIRLLVFLLFSPCIAGVFYWAIMDFAVFQADSFLFEEFHDPGIRFLSKYGDEFSSYHMIFYIRNMENWYYNEGHDDVVVALANKFPEEKENYISVVVSTILDPDTTHKNRDYLFQLLEKLTGEKFYYISDDKAGYGITAEEWPHTEKAMRGIAGWWAERQRARAEESIKALRKNNKRKPQ